MKFKKTPLNKLTLFSIFLIASSMLLLLVINSKVLAIGIYGNAVAADLLGGKTATVDAGSITGTMTNMASSNSSVSNAVASGTLYTRISPGAYLTPTGSGYPEITSSVPDLVAGNILGGKNILGVAGSITNYSGGVHILSQQNTVGNYDGEGYNSVYAQPPAGYYDGASWIRTREANLVAANIKSGVSILGIVGTAVDGTGLKRFASGGVTAPGGLTCTVSGIGFVPSVIYVSNSNPSSMSYMHGATGNSNMGGSTVIGPSGQGFYFGYPYTYSIIGYWSWWAYE